jgi:hypothetical protein
MSLPPRPDARLRRSPGMFSASHCSVRRTAVHHAPARPAFLSLSTVLSAVHADCSGQIEIRTARRLTAVHAALRPAPLRSHPLVFADPQPPAQCAVTRIGLDLASFIVQQLCPFRSKFGSDTVDHGNHILRFLRPMPRNRPDRGGSRSRPADRPARST